MPTRLRNEQLGLVTPAELAQALEVTEQTLATWRSMHKGPAYVRFGKQVYYRLTDVARYAEAHVVEPSRDTGDAASAAA